MCVCVWYGNFHEAINRLKVLTGRQTECPGSGDILAVVMNWSAHTVSCCGVVVLRAAVPLTNSRRGKRAKHRHEETNNMPCMVRCCWLFNRSSLKPTSEIFNHSELLLIDWAVLSVQFLNSPLETFSILDFCHFIWAVLNESVWFQAVKSCLKIEDHARKVYSPNLTSLTVAYNINKSETQTSP